VDHTICGMHGAVIVPPGEGTRYGNVEFLARTADTPRFTFGIISFQAGRTLEPHVHPDEDDSFYILDGEIVFTLGEQGDEVTAGPGTFVLVPPGVRHGFSNRTDQVVRILNLHAPAGFDLRVAADD
jgi:quercetin dioxygenase-like cupin family protein